MTTNLNLLSKNVFEPLHKVQDGTKVRVWSDGDDLQKLFLKIENPMTSSYWGRGVLNKAKLVGVNAGEGSLKATNRVLELATRVAKEEFDALKAEFETAKKVAGTYQSFTPQIKAFTMPAEVAQAEQKIKNINSFIEKFSKTLINANNGAKKLLENYQKVKKPEAVTDFERTVAKIDLLSREVSGFKLNNLLTNINN